ncbi:MAG: hypothetical protein OQJ89_04315, partial [Kangiellaceae bacterium]|nr:hypothetical protein [Kangiellaceae bacterium]
GDATVRADIGIYFPKGYQLILETTFGNIKAKKHYSSIRAKTTLGNISVATHGAVDLSSEMGNVYLNPLSNRWKKSQQVLTRAGNVTLLLPEDVDLKLIVQAAKGIVSNFERNGIDSHSDKFGRFTSSLGKALTSLNIRALNGTAELIYERKTDEDYLVSHLN